jgi:Tfp pilus assembly protein PilF
MTAELPPKSAALANFERMLSSGKDSALLRFSLGIEYLKAGDANAAADHLSHSVAQDPDYTAAWKLLGKSLAAADRHDEARAAYDRGIEVAKRKGDKQAEREMRVFAGRLRPSGGS